jgi:uncharacterized membrane protein YdfJ with MMPL/SSD domain
MIPIPKRTDRDRDWSRDQDGDIDGERARFQPYGKDSLSMDYHVFILSRVREAYDRGMSTDDAVAYGIKTTAGTVTSAAVVRVGAFLIFATIVRAFLLPASMKLLGDWNWYLPKWLEWLPQVKHETQPDAVPVPAAA